MSDTVSAPYLRAQVIRCSRNSFTVREEGSDDNFLECNIKGKVLKSAERFYNPLAPGDWVIAAADPAHPGKGQIVSLETRRNVFSRFNQKGQTPQLLAANVDLALCLTTPSSPPFRPRFLDRVLLQADSAGIEAVIVCNKSDLGIDDMSVKERLDDFSRSGYRLFNVSAKTGAGIDELRYFLAGKYSVMIGQSGVGKSSLINALIPGINARVGDINEKYDRGNHTTVMPVMLESGTGNDVIRIIDTPGIRRFVPDGIAADQVIVHLREFAPLAGKCNFGLSCSHRTEQGCKIIEAVNSGAIHSDRYNSFLRIYDELSGDTRKNYDD